MVVFPPCKINLGLAVLSKRTDGFHNLETCFYPIPWVDVLEIIPSETFAFSISGNLIPGAPEENLCVKAYSLLKKDFDLPSIKIHLHKIIPPGAGLGGGSSDGAYTLRLLNTIFSLGLSQQELINYAARLGSDCAFFIHDRAMMGKGRGEILEDVAFSLKGKFLVVVKPGIHVSTAEAFGGITPHHAVISIHNIILQYPIHQWKGLLKNDFEDSVFKKYPTIKMLKEKLYQLGAIYASMTGSGAAVFGIFDGEVVVADQFADAIIWCGFAE